MSLLPQIDPDRLYTLTEASRLIPCSVAGKRVSLDTVYRWRSRGKLRCVRCAANGRYLVRGSVLLDLFSEDAPPASAPPTSAERRARRLATARRLARFGVKSNAK